MLLPLIHVVTAGGGANDASTNPFGRIDGGPDTGSSSSSSGGSSSSSGSMADDGAASDSGEDSMTSNDSGACANYTSPTCNGAPCDLRTHTCCITVQLLERCVDNAVGKCNSNEAAVHCSQACDCPSGQSCCGTIDTLLGSVQSQCTSLNPSVNGGACEPNNVSQVSGQLCAVDGECENGGACVYQTCIYGAMLHLCGVQSQSPFDCAANSSDD